MSSEDLAIGSDSGLQAQQFHNVSSLQRQLADLSFAEGIADTRVGGIYLGSFGGDIHDLAGGAERHSEIKVCGRIHQQLDVALAHGRKARLLGYQLVASWCDLQKAVLTIRISRAFADSAVVSAPNGHGGVGNHRARRISDGSTQGRSRLRICADRPEHNNKEACGHVLHSERPTHGVLHRCQRKRDLLSETHFPPCGSRTFSLTTHKFVVKYSQAVTSIKLQLGVLQPEPVSSDPQ